MKNAQEQVDGTSITRLPNGALAFHPENGTSSREIAQALADFMRRTEGVQVDVLACEQALLVPGGALFTPNTASLDSAKFFNNRNIVAQAQPSTVAVIGDEACISPKEEQGELPYEGIGIVLSLALLAWIIRRIRKKPLAGRVSRGKEFVFLHIPPESKEWFDWKSWLNSSDDK